MPVVYFLFRIIARLISWLPFPLLYLLSDILFFKMYYIFRYRKKVVLLNLKNAFPEKSDHEIQRITRKYYRHLADVILEIIKLGSMSGDQLVKRIHYNNMLVMDEILNTGRSIILAIGHIGNWEWNPIGLQRIFYHQKAYAAYKPLSNKYFDKYYHKVRSHLLINTELVPYKNLFRTLVKARGEQNFTLVVADQTPHKDEINYWTHFLNQNTGFFTGIEKMATTFNSAVLFLDMMPVRRGYYEVDIIKITDDPGKNPPNEIIERYVHLLEESIRRYPHNWLWSHRRWKYKREEKGERRNEK